MSEKLPSIERRTLSVLEAARSTGLSRSSIFRADRRLLTVKVGNRRLIRPSALEALLDAGAGK
jgi:hypothetical protein